MNKRTLKKWIQVQTTVQLFLKHCLSEYQSKLKKRPKWKTNEPSIKIAGLAILKEDNAR